MTPFRMRVLFLWRVAYRYRMPAASLAASPHQVAPSIVTRSCRKLHRASRETPIPICYDSASMALEMVMFVQGFGFDKRSLPKRQIRNFVGEAFATTTDFARCLTAAEVTLQYVLAMECCSIRHEQERSLRLDRWRGRGKISDEHLLSHYRHRLKLCGLT